MTRMRGSFACGSIGVLLIALLMVTDYDDKVYAAAPCTDLSDTPCNKLRPPTKLCTGNNCVPQAGGGGVECPYLGNQVTPNNNSAWKCIKAATGAMDCNTGAGVAPTNCGTQTTCNGCAMNMAGIEVCQPVLPLQQINYQGDSLQGGSCPPLGG